MDYITLEEASERQVYKWRIEFCWLTMKKTLLT